MSNDIAIGSHLVSQRYVKGAPIYTHHGIYAGNGEVIHYAGWSQDPEARGSTIQGVNLERFHGDVGYLDCPARDSSFHRHQRQEHRGTPLSKPGCGRRGRGYRAVRYYFDVIR